MQFLLVLVCSLGAIFLLTEYPANMWANILGGFLLAIFVICLLSLIVYAKRSRFGSVEPPPAEDRLHAADRSDSGTPPSTPSDQSKESPPGSAKPESALSSATPATSGSGNQGGTTAPSPPQPPPPLPDPPPPPPKVFHPEYAIGQGLITRDEYNRIQDEYFAQSQMSLGLILPVCVLAYALSKSQQLSLDIVSMRVLGAGLAVLFVVGMDRWHKFDSELQALILSRWNKVQKADAQAQQDAAGGKAQAQLIKTLADAIAKDIKEALKPTTGDGKNK
jgi:hypothetical protein